MTEEPQDEGPITSLEFFEMFGDQIPIEAARLIYEAGPDQTIGQVRAALRALAKPPGPTITATEGMVLNLGGGASIDMSQCVVPRAELLELLGVAIGNVAMDDVTFWDRVKAMMKLVESQP